MLKVAEPRLQSGDEYTKLLLQERRRHLRSLARRYAQHRITAGEYESCRESLLQAIAELIKIERNAEEQSAERKSRDVSNLINRS